MGGRGGGGGGVFFFSSRRRHTRSLCDWSSDVCSSDLVVCKVQASPLSTQDYSAINVTSAFDPSLASTYGYPQQTKLNRDTIEVS